MKMLLEFTFRAEVETEISANQSETKVKARDLLVSRLPTNILGRKIELGCIQDKMSINVVRDVMTVRTIHVEDDARSKKMKTNKGK